MSTDEEMQRVFREGTDKTLAQKRPPLTGRELDREVMLQLICRLLSPIMAPGGGLGPASATYQIRKLEEELREELGRVSEPEATNETNDCHPLCAKKAGHEGSCSGLADELDRVRPTWPAFNHTREDSPLHPCEDCQGAVLEYVEWLEGDLKRLKASFGLLREMCLHFPRAES